MGNEPRFKEIEDYLPTQQGKALDGENLELREYQQEAFDSLEAMRANKETITLLYHATGTGKTALVLGALSCGAYKCPPTAVARQFCAVMEEHEFKSKFKLLVFAILERPRRPQGLDGEFAPFYH